MKNFVYLVGDSESPLTAVVDPAWSLPDIEAALARDGRQLSAVLLTHHHHDHLNAVPELLRRHDVPVYAQQAEISHSEVLAPFKSALRAVAPGDVVKLGSLDITCIHTPGHTPGSQCFSVDGALLSGDTLFVNACGRCDFAGSDARQMYESLHHVLGKLPDETTLLPGHHYGDVVTSSLGRERERNPYFQHTHVDSFVAHRLGGLVPTVGQGKPRSGK